MTLRPRLYQLECVEKVFQELEAVRSTLVSAFVGSGKTVIFSLIAKQWLQLHDTRVMIIAHREELIFQARSKIADIVGIHPEIEMGDLSADDADWTGKCPVVITSIQTQNAGPVCKSCVCYGCMGDGHIKGDKCSICNGVGCDNCTDGFMILTCQTCKGKGRSRTDCNRCIDGRRLRMQKFDPREFGLVIVDESHHITARSYRRAVKHYANAKILGVTATPDRADEEALGQIFDSVAFTYDIPDGINDGWLVPIDQRLVRVEDLDFSQCRTTAGDLNQGDLEHALLPAMDIDRDEPGLSTEDREKIQKEERLLHGMVGPTIELAGDMPTLIFAASVSHAERVAEIINRHHEGSAVCLHGKTPADERRTQLQRFANGEFQYLVNVGLFLEGWDQPKVACVAVYRATKSRSLYAQILGRALRPLPGIVDGEDTDADTRKEAISMSGKNSALILDFCGNSGKHKLVTAADLLGGHYSDEVVQLAKAAIIKKNTGGKSADALLELRTAQKQIEERERQKRREIMARARFDTQVVSPFDIFDLPVGREPGWFKGKRPSQRMIEVLQKSGIETAELTFWEAKRLIGRMAERRDQGMCTFRQAKLLARHGYNTNMTFEEAKRTIDQIAKDNNWAQRSQK